MARYPDYQVELLEPTPNTPTSLGLPGKELNLPLSSSREAWLAVQAQTREGKGRQTTRSSLASSGLKRPKQNPQPMGRGGGNNKGKGLFSGQSAKREKAMERKGQDVLDVWTPACM